MKSFKCPMCGTEMNESTEEDLVRAVQQHAKEQHGQDLLEDRAKEMVGKEEPTS
jgi:predicted small metal-binding protein